MIRGASSTVFHQTPIAAAAASAAAATAAADDDDDDDSFTILFSRLPAADETKKDERSRLRPPSLLGSLLGGDATRLRRLLQPRRGT